MRVSRDKAVENRQRIVVPRKPVRIHESAHEFVEAVGWKTVFCVVFRCNRLRIQIVQSHNALPQLLLSTDCIHPRQG